MVMVYKSPCEVVKHYHGWPITPSTAALEVAQAGHVFLSMPNQQYASMVLEMTQSFALDNGAFPAWSAGKPIRDWTPFYEWVADLKRHPGFDFAVIPDVIDGGEAENDALIDEWPHGPFIGAPVWHMHESYARLVRLCKIFPRVCIGSSGEFRTVGTAQWWDRIESAMNLVCDSDGYPITKLHGLRMLNPKVFTKLPLSSADSTNIARNVGIDKNWAKGNYPPLTKEARARSMRQRIEHFNGAERWQSTI